MARTRRRWIALAVGVLIAAPAIALAGLVSSSGTVNQQSHFEAQGGASTGSRQWRGIPGLKNLSVCFGDGAPMSAAVSLTVRGGPFGLRVTVDGDPLEPGAASFEPALGRRSFAFTFAGAFTTLLRDVDVQWRATGGERVRLSGGDATFLYRLCP